MVQQARSRGYRVTLLTLQVGSRGVPHYDSLAKLARVLGMPNKDLASLIGCAAKAAINGHSRFGVLETEHLNPSSVM